MRKIFLSILMIGFLSISAQKKKVDNEFSMRLIESMNKSTLEVNEELKLNHNNTELFNGKIEIINKNTIKYDQIVVFIYVENNYLPIFEKGIFFPQLIIRKSKLKQINSEKESTAYLRDDSITISDFIEIKKYNITPNIKEFSFWLFYKNHYNPTEYHIILKNEKIKEETDLETFLEDAIATEIQYVTLII